MVCRIGVLAIALLVSLALPFSALAQGTSRVTFRPSFRTVGVYDDNLFATAGERVGSYYLRFTPAVTTGYAEGAFSFDARYSFNAELYPDERSDLNDPFASQRASIGLGYALTRTAALSFNAAYGTSNRPSELVEDTGLELGRRESQSYSAGLSFSKQLSTRDGWNVGYNAGLLEFQGSSSSISHSVATSWSHRYSSLSATQLTYSYRVYSFGDELTSAVLDGRSAQSHLVTFGWTRRLNERTSMTLQVGPRLSTDFVNINAADDVELNRENALGADATASLNYSRDETNLSLAYTRRQNQVFARSGFVDTDSLILSFGRGLGQSFRFSVSPGVYRNTRGSAETWTYRASVNASQSITRWLQFNASYRYSLQEGRFVNTLDGGIVDGRRLDRNVVTVGLTLGHTFEE